MKKVKFFQPWGAVLAAIVLITALSISAAAEPETNFCTGIAPPTLSAAATSGQTDEEKAAQKALQAAALIDGVYANGNNNSSWALRADYHYNETNPPAATLDLGAAKKVGKCVVTGASAYAAMVPANFDIQYSTDGTAWQTAKEVRGNTNMTCMAAFSNIEAQYWRIAIRFESKTSGEWSRITEIELYEGSDGEGGGNEGGETGETDTTTNWCLNLPPTLDKASTSGANDEEKAAQRALQAASLVNGKVEGGNSNTSWMIRGDYHKPSASATFDLGAERTIGKWVITGASSYKALYPVNFDILSSADGISYRTVTEVRDNADYEATIEFSNVTARYWKLIVYFTATEQYRISEIEMYGGQDVFVPVIPPVVTMETPENMTQIEAGNTLSLCARASCESADIKSVTFLSGDTVLAEAAYDSAAGLWKADVPDVAYGNYTIAAKAVSEQNEETVSESIRVRVHGTGVYNVALGNEVTPSVASNKNTNPGALTDGKSDDADVPFRWYMSATNAQNGVSADIDLDGGFDNLYSIESIKLYSGDPQKDYERKVTDFTIYTWNGEKWEELIKVTENENIEWEYTLPTPIKTGGIRLFVNQSKAFAVKEMEVMGRRADGLKKAATVVTDGSTGKEIKAIEKGTVICAEAEILNAATEGSKKADVMSLLAVKNGDGKVLTAVCDTKTVPSGAAETFALRASCPEGEDMYGEVFWLDAHTLEPLFPKNVIRSKEKIYNEDEVVVSVTTAGFDVYLKGTDAYGTDYVKIPFKHTVNETTNADLYRIINAYAVERTGDTTFTQTIQAPLLSPGELELAMREIEDGVVAEDFIGGYHGDEILSKVTLKVDGTEVDLTKAASYKGTKVEFVQEAAINKCNKPSEVVANHTKSYVIDKTGITLDQTLDWVDSITLTAFYPCMFPVYRYDGKTQVTDYITYTEGGKKIVYDTRGNKSYNMSPIPEVFEATVYSETNGYSAHVKYMPKEGLSDHIFFFQMRDAGDTKIYFGANMNNVPQAGEHWIWTSIYQFDINKDTIK